MPYAQAAALPPPGAPFVETVNRTIDAHVVVEGGVQGAHFVNCTWRHLGGAGLHFVGGSRVISDCHVRKTATEYDRKTGIKWLSCTGK